MMSHRVTIGPGISEMAFAADGDGEQIQLESEQKELVDAVGATVKAYLVAAHSLAQGKYAHLRHLIPIHLAERGKTLVLCCPDGIAIRYETCKEAQGIARAWSLGSLAESVEELSQNVVHCYDDSNYESKVSKSRYEFKLEAVNP